MVLDIRWLAPAALIASASPACFAVQYLTVEQAQALIFPQAKEFTVADVKLTPEQIQEIEKIAVVRVRVPRLQIWQAKAGDKVVGWFIVDQVVGKHDLITYAAGITPEGALRQLQILEYREAYGYQVRDVRWRDQFAGKTAADTLRVGTDILNISGATLSCQHLSEGIKRLLATHQVALR